MLVFFRGDTSNFKNSSFYDHSDGHKDYTVNEIKSEDLM